MTEMHPDLAAALEVPGATPTAPNQPTAPVDDRQNLTASEIWEQRIAALETQLKANTAELEAYRAQAAADGLTEEERLATWNHTYDAPHDYPFQLILATGEIVGHPNVQSTRHTSRKLGYDVPVHAVTCRES